MASLKSKGLTLHTRDWEISNPKADLYFAHGFFGHSGRYDFLASYFNKLDFNFHSFDFRTHGLSEGKPKCYMNDFSAYLEDYKHFLNSHLKQVKRPFFLFGHSFGGLVICSFLAEMKFEHPLFRGIMLSAPFLATDNNTAPILQKLAGVIGRLLPKLKVLELEKDQISNNAAEVEAYIEDELVYSGKMHAATGWQLLKQTKAIQLEFSKITAPLIIMHGDSDKIANIDGSHLLFENSTSTDKEFIIVENNKHEILKDISYETTLKKFASWANERITD